MLLVFKREITQTYLFYFTETETMVSISKPKSRYQRPSHKHLLIKVNERDLRRYFNVYPDFKLIYSENNTHET